jgi:ABC-2 type transport system permease protein
MALRHANGSKPQMSDLYLFRASLRDMLRPRRVAAAVLLATLPVALAIAWRSTTPGAAFNPGLVYNIMAGGIVFGFTLVILAVLFATGVVTQEVEQKTIVYLLTRPVSRARVLLARFAAAAVTVTAIVWVSCVLVALVAYGPADIAQSRLARDLLVLPIGVLAYGSVFLLAATIIPKPLIYGLLFAFGWESWVAMIPGSFQRMSIMAYLRVLAPHPQMATSERGPAEMLQALNPETIAVHTAWLVIAALIPVALGLALLAFSVREYAPKDDAE